MPISKPGICFPSSGFKRPQFKVLFANYLLLKKRPVRDLIPRQIFQIINSIELIFYGIIIPLCALLPGRNICW